MNNKTMVIVAISILIIAIILLYLPNGHSQTRTKNAGTKIFPVLFIHGHFSDASIWKKCESLLNKDGIPSIQ
jgi:uncharacterized alpha/beta hydrolase family protein